MSLERAYKNCKMCYKISNERYTVSPIPVEAEKLRAYYFNEAMKALEDALKVLLM